MAVKALVPDLDGVKSARYFAAWIGLAPEVPFQPRQEASWPHLQDEQSGVAIALSRIIVDFPISDPGL
ncbi:MULTISPECIES: hypothetical protein [unclassified Rhizobium]|uniref:hypothetical protein n=1 Tax=unclassified Rhizobium TaxID=2613769 RepID=UPI001FCD76F7|nr:MULTISPECIES: hypothetical protein [unclassified Rhizobium]